MQTTPSLNMITKMMLLLFVATVFSVSHAAYPCQAPALLTFEAHRHDYADTHFRRYFTEYDKNNMRVVFFEISFDGTTRDTREFLFLHQIDAGFDLDFKTKQCKRFRAGPFRPFEVPFNATYDGEFTLGGPNEGVIVDRWSDRIPGKRRETWVGEFSHSTCYPVSQFVLDLQDFNRTSITHFHNVVQGIVNPNDFNVPHECFSAPEVEIPVEARIARSLYVHSSYP